MTPLASTYDRRNAGIASSTLTVARRALLRYLRTPQLIVLATVQMSLFFLIYRYMFGGAIHVAGIDYVDFLVPGFIATGVLFSGIGTATAMAEDLEQGFIDRLRSLPIPRSAVLAARAARGHGDLRLEHRVHRGDRVRRRLPAARLGGRRARRVRPGDRVRVR